MAIDFKAMLDAAGQLQQQLERAQGQMARVTVTGEAGAGLVRVVMNGHHQLQEVHIDPAAAKDDVHLLEDLLRAAVNQASERLSERLQQNLGGMVQGMGIDLKDILGPTGGGQGSGGTP